MSQDMKFVKPVHLGETVRARVTVTEIDQGKKGCIWMESAAWVKPWWP